MGGMAQSQAGQAQWGGDANSMVNANGQFDMNAMMMMGMVSHIDNYEVTKPILDDDPNGRSTTTTAGIILF